MTEDSGKARVILGVILLVLTAALACLLIFKPPTDEFVKAQLTIILGVFIAKLGDMFVFYFGTSAGAKTLSAAQAETAKAAVDLAKGTGNGNALSNAKPAGTADDPVVTEDAATAAPADPPARIEDTPEYQLFKKQLLGINPTLSDAQVRATWDAHGKTAIGFAQA